MTNEEQSQRGWRELARDAGVNVVANLIAAAIIYLLAVAGGYLNANPWIIAGILTPPLILAGVAAMLYALALLGRWGRWPWLALPVVLLVLAGTVVVLIYLHKWADPTW
ncbi:hypothetical protein KBX71_12045 [Micromonospora sp. D93]|uniref:hypothetical protein n=1 Tax=Micromonospora sp. D93 TaxID=2824886 RepID=UPI001B378F44|nr:hypothetical protein [Micromonospora sp. D93]MBQ1018588.1 hypothetical protein [Micromonospora sp. D93]